MPFRSESHLGDVVVSASERPAAVQPVLKTANEVSGYQSVLKPFQAVRKSLDPIDPNVRNKTRMSHDLSVYANNEYVFATFPIALALFWDKGGERNLRITASNGNFYDSDPLSEYNGPE